MTHCTMHAVARAEQRYEIDLTDEVAEGWVWAIFLRKVSLVAGISKRIKVYDVPHRGRKVRVVYDPTARKIITVTRIMKGRI